MLTNRVLITVIACLCLFTMLIGCSSTQTEGEAPTKPGGESSTPTEDVALEYPTKPIQILIPTDAGSIGDIFVRNFAKVAEKYIDQPIVPDNRVGGGEAIAITHMNSQPADGHTIKYNSEGLALRIAAESIPVTLEDLVPVGSMIADYQVIAVLEDSPFQTFEEFHQFAKENPGVLKVGGGQLYGSGHILVEKIVSAGEVEIDFIPYDGNNQAVLSMLGGNVDAVSVSSGTLKQQVEAGEMRILAVSTAERVPDNPDIPTLKEAGLSNFSDQVVYRSFYVKPGTPLEMIDKFNEIMYQVAQDPEWQEFIKNAGYMEFYKDSVEFTEYFNGMIKDAQELMADIN